MRIQIAALLLIFSSPKAFAGGEATTRLPDAEKAAEEYVTAFFHSDLRRAALLTHPDTLQQIKSAFTREWESAQASGKEAEFLAKSGIDAATNLRSLGLLDLYVTVIQGSRRSAPDAAAAMKATTVAVTGSERVDAERAAVTLSITTPAGEATRTQDSKLLLARVDDGWKVVGNAK